MRMSDFYRIAVHVIAPKRLGRALGSTCSFMLLRQVLLSVVKVIRKFGFGGSFMSLRHLQSNLLQKLAFTWVFRISIYLVRNPPMRARLPTD